MGAESREILAPNGLTATARSSDSPGFKPFKAAPPLIRYLPFRLGLFPHIRIPLKLQRNIQHPV